MKVNGIDYRSVWMEGLSVYLIDQTLLPFHFEVKRMENHYESCDAIRSMMTRGAGAIGALAGFAMAQAAFESRGLSYELLIRQAKERIAATRPTARDLFDSLERVFAAALNSPEEAYQKALDLADANAEAGRKIGQHGKALIRDGMGILTHCNAGWLALVDYGSALAPIYAAADDRKHFTVYVDETRPRAQGARLTAWELNAGGIDHHIIPDNAAAWLMKQGKIDLVITGADRIAVNGDTANKIGTLEKALAAKYFDIPFYVAAPTSTFDTACKSGEDIPIEDRSPDEVMFQEGPDENGILRKIRLTSPGSPVLNPAFDVTPSELITGFITEEGIALC